MRGSRGFTLIELLVAVALFATLAALAYGSVDALIRAREQLDAADDRLRALQQAVAVFERDLRAGVSRPVREAYGEVRPALLGERGRVELSRLRGGGLADTSAQTTRVAYAVRSGTLLRTSSTVLDAAPSSPTRSRRLLDDVDSLSLRYLDAQGRWRDVWPSADLAGRDASAVLPRAVDVRIDAGGYGEIHRIIELPRSPEVVAPPAGPGPVS